jgi:hypothetical protein
VCDGFGDPVTCAAIRILATTPGFEAENILTSGLDGQYQMADIPVELEGFPLTDFVLEVCAPFFMTELDFAILIEDFDPFIGQARYLSTGASTVDFDLVSIDSDLNTTFSGQVVDEDTGIPLAGVRVEAFGDGPPLVPPVVTYTCSDGSFQLTDLPASKAGLSFTLNFSAPDYEVEDVPPPSGCNAGALGNTREGGAGLGGDAVRLLLAVSSLAMAGRRPRAQVR